MVIQYNKNSMFANRNLNINTTKDSTHMERLSSGYRINRAADDAAGLCISEKMRWNARGLRQDVRNIQDGVSLVQVADGALSEVQAMLHRITELSVQAANDTNTDADRRAIQKEINELKLDINRISTDTMFNDTIIFKPTNTPEIKGAPTDIMVYHEDSNKGVRDGGILYNGKRYAYGSPNLDVKFDANDNIIAGEYNLKAEGEGGKEVLIPLIFDGGNRAPSARKYILDPRTDGIYIDEIQHAWSDIKKSDGTALDPKNIESGTYSFTHAGLTFSFDVREGTDLDTLMTELKADGLETYSLQSGDYNLPRVPVNPGIDMSDISPIDTAKKDYIPRNNYFNSIVGGYRMHADANGIQMYLPSMYNDNKGDINFTHMTWEDLGLSEWTQGESVNPGSSVSGGERYQTYQYRDSMTGTTISFNVDSEVSKNELISAINSWQITVTTNTEMKFEANYTGAGTNISIGKHSPSLDIYGTQNLMGRDIPNQLVLQNGMTLEHDLDTDALSFTMKDGNGQTYDFSVSNVEDNVRSRVESCLNDYIRRYASAYRDYLNRTQGGLGSPSVDSSNNGSLTFKDSAFNYSVDINYTMAFDGWLNNNDFEAPYTVNPVTGWRTYYSVTPKPELAGNLATKIDSLVGDICNALKNTEVSVKTDDGSNLKATTQISSPAMTGNARYRSQVISGKREIMIQAGPLSQQGIKIPLPSMNTGILGIGGIDVSTHSSASAAITSTAKALDKVSDMRSQFGATQNRLEHAMAVNQINAENTSAAESRLRDADMAEEMMEHAKYNILIQAGQSILAQANHTPDSMLEGLLPQ